MLSVTAESNQRPLLLTLAEDDGAVFGALRFGLGHIHVPHPLRGRHSAAQIVPDDLSPERVRCPNSLRSNMGTFSPFPAAMLGKL